MPEISVRITCIQPLSFKISPFCKEMCETRVSRCVTKEATGHCVVCYSTMNSEAFALHSVGKKRFFFSQFNVTLLDKGSTLIYTSNVDPISLRYFKFGLILG